MKPEGSKELPEDRQIDQGTGRSRSSQERLYLIIGTAVVLLLLMLIVVVVWKLRNVSDSRRIPHADCQRTGGPPRNRRSLRASVRRWHDLRP
jgi:hypothetical protein